MDWQAMVFLGAYHGINPGMGWLFAVALGMQRGSARGVWGALPPIALGHAAAVGVVLLTVGLAQIVIPMDTLRVLVASMLTMLGLVPAVASSASAIRRDAGGVSRSDRVVVSDGVGTWRGLHGGSVRDVGPADAVGGRP